MDNKKNGFVTIADVARHANVSKMTVSRVINRSSKVSPETLARIQQAIKELGFVPNAIAQNLSRGQGRSLALIIPDVRNPFFTDVAYGVEEVAQRQDYGVFLCNSDGLLDKEQRHVDMVISNRISGLIITVANDQSRKLIKRLIERTVPFVLLFREIDNVAADLVTSDGIYATRMLTNHLINLGHRRIAFLNGPLNISTSRYRAQGFREMLDSHTIPFDPAMIIETTLTRESVAAPLQYLLDLPDEMRPTAIMTGSSITAVALIGELRSRGLRVPEDMAVVCFEDIELASALDPFLTVVAHPARTFGNVAAQLLLDRVNQPINQSSPQRITLLPELIVRRSCGAMMHKV